MHECTARCPAGTCRSLGCFCSLSNVVLPSVTMEPQCSLMASASEAGQGFCSVPAQDILAKNMALHGRSPAGACKALEPQDTCVHGLPRSACLHRAGRPRIT